MNANRKWKSFLSLLVLLGLMGSLFVVASVQGQSLNGDMSGDNLAATIQVDATSSSIKINPLILGTNLPAWLNPWRFTDGTFQARSSASGVPMVRMPGGSWSNGYDWLACERWGQGIDSNAVCWWTWASRPSDFIDFLQATNLEGMWTINQNGTAKEAAALVAFMNGSTSDQSVIGVDVRGRDWGKVGDWAQLRATNGNPEPIGIKYWEIGNEIFGGKIGKDCLWWGWEDVWTCDGREYVLGIGSGSDRKEGFLEYAQAMKAVDPTILIGAVGVSDQSGWSNWGNEVLEEAGQTMDFYLIHEYGFFDPPGSFAELLARPQALWQPIMQNVLTAFDQYAGGRRVPIAVTEYNLFSVQERDPDQWMSKAVNGLYIADTIGQMIQHGFSIGNQWNLANGGDSPGYGMMHADTYFRSPQYYAFKIWSRFGGEMLPVTSSRSADTELSIYAGRVDANTLTILAINKTGNPIEAQVELVGPTSVVGGSVDLMQATSLDDLAVTFNGVSDPSNDLSNAPSIPLTNLSNPLNYTFQPYSVSLLRVQVDDAGQPQPTSTEPTVTPTPSETPTPTSSATPPTPTDFLFLPVISGGGP